MVAPSVPLMMPAMSHGAYATGVETAPRFPPQRIDAGPELAAWVLAARRDGTAHRGVCAPAAAPRGRATTASPREQSRQRGGRSPGGHPRTEADPLTGRCPLFVVVRHTLHSNLFSFESRKRARRLSLLVHKKPRWSRRRGKVRMNKVFHRAVVRSLLVPQHAEQVPQRNIPRHPLHTHRRNIEVPLG